MIQNSNDYSIMDWKSLYNTGSHHKSVWNSTMARKTHSANVAKDFKTKKSKRRKKTKTSQNSI